MTPTEKAKRSDALYYETVSVTRRVLCDMVANREADLEDARAESEHMRLKALAVAGELQEESERLRADNDRLREEFNKMDVWHSKELAAAMADNAKLREQVDAAHMSRLLTENENESLRELCADVWHLFTEHGAVNPCDLPVVDAVRDRMRELGVDE